ncbi:MAG: hypothetical protein QNK54_06440 [Candidatus Planktophila sp.]
MRLKGRTARVILLSLALTLIPISTNSTIAAGPQTPSCGNFKVTKNSSIVGIEFPKGSYQVNAFGISCKKVMGSKGLFAKFLKLKNNKSLPKPWRYLADAVGAPKFSSGPGVGFRVEQITSVTRSPTVEPVATGTPTPTPTSPSITTATYPWKSVCDPDPWVPADWASYEKFALKYFGCSRPYRFFEVPLTDTLPKNTLNEAKTSLSVCKIPERPETQNVGFRPNGFQFNGDLTIQILPISFNDFQASGSVEKEYGKYLAYIKDTFYKLSDGNTRITFKSPENFISLGSDLESYIIPGSISHSGIVFKKVNVKKYQNDIFAKVDPLINFTGIKMTVILVPLSVPPTYIPHSPQFRMDNVSTGEGVVSYNYLWPSAAEVSRDSWYGVEPFVHIHEFFHAIGILNDHVGDESGNNSNDLGTGRWGAMSGMMTDFILWDKWLAGMLRDSQVICATPNTSGTYWLKPAGVYGEYQKLLVIPISNTKVIAIESKRAAGLDYKLTSKQQGALIMVVDTTKSGQATGINVIRPPMRTGSTSDNFGFILGDAPLKSGESITVEGIKISVVESGDFGDIIQIG